MGNSSSQNNQDYLPKSPLLLKLRNHLTLIPTNRMTSSFISEEMLKNLRKKSGAINRKANPFCVMEISQGRESGGEQWLTCCLISPIMAIASPRVICDENNSYYRTATIRGISRKGQYEDRTIKKVVVIQQRHVCLVLFDKPLLELGWAGMTYLKNRNEISNQSFHVINHPNRKALQQSSHFEYSQHINKCLYSLEEQYLGQHKELMGSIVFKVIREKPYVVGIQINENQCRFFDEKIFSRVQQVVNKQLSGNRQKQILSQIDIQEYQLMQKL